MREVLEEIHRATMMDERAAALYEPLVPAGNKLCVVCWDSFPAKVDKPTNQRDQKGTFCTKTGGNCLLRTEGVDLEGKPVFKLCMCASISPRATDEGVCHFILDTEEVVGLPGGLKAMLVGLPGYTMVHLFDNGYR